MRHSLIISESGLYKFIMRSDKPQARAFQEGVTREVLRPIRKTGAYVSGQPSIVENPNMDPLSLLMSQIPSRNGRSITTTAPIIKDFKDFNGLPIVFREDGYINMTRAGKHYGKDPKEFSRNKSTAAYCEALEAIGGISPNALKQARRGSASGTYCHPKLAVFFARWLDVRFAVWCGLA